jgi:hypothetical protein
LSGVAVTIAALGAWPPVVVMVHDTVVVAL